MTERHHELIGLTAVLTNIARGVPGVLKAPPGPNSWDDIAPSDFGPEHDFTVDDESSIFIFTPVSEAGKQWCYKHLPECPRWGIGYAIEHRYITDIVAGAQRDGLQSREDYVAAMEENEQQNSGIDEEDGS